VNDGSYSFVIRLTVLYFLHYFTTETCYSHVCFHITSLVLTWVAFYWWTMP